MEPIKTLKRAKEIVGHASGLGKPSKMPGFSTAIPAEECKTGARLRKIKGSVCANCYAFRGNYGTPDVKKGLRRRFKALEHKDWTRAMFKLIAHYTDPADPYFRIHDSGDFQSVEHILRWVEIAKLNADIMYWAPTKEYRMYRKARALVDSWPHNLVIRLSAPMIGARPPKSWKGMLSSTVNAGIGHECPAPTQDNACGPCRACWDITVENIDYHKH